MKIPFLDLKAVNEPYFSEISAICERVVRSGRYVGGEECETFERVLAEKTGTKFCVGVSNGLDALRLIIEAYKALGVFKSGDEIIVPANTYIASILAISQAGLTPVLVEPTLETLNIDTSAIEAKITAKTRGIMTVHLYGRVAFDSTMKEIAAKYGLKIIEDNAQAIGAVSDTPGVSGNSCITGGLGDAGAFSFYPTKNIGALGDAGAVTTNDEELAKMVRTLANYGSDRRYHNIQIGYNCRLDPIQAAILTLKLKDLDAICSHRQKLAQIYDENIKNSEIIKPVIPQNPLSHVWHQYVILTENRDALRSKLAEAGIGTDINYPTPPHLQPCYANTLVSATYPITERICCQCLSLPLSTALTQENAIFIALFLMHNS